MKEEFPTGDIEESREEVPSFERGASDILENELKRIGGFEPSGDVTTDAEAFLRLTGRDRYLEDTTDLSQLLREIKEFQEESLNPESDLYHDVEGDGGDPRVRELLLRDIPSAEISVIDSILSGIGADGKEAISGAVERLPTPRDEDPGEDDFWESSPGPQTMKRVRQLQAKYLEYGTRLEASTEGSAGEQDVSYKQLVVHRALLEGEVDPKELAGYLRNSGGERFDGPAFRNAIKVVRDYVETGGTNISRGTGLTELKIVKDREGDILYGPENIETFHQLQSKYKEYEERIEGVQNSLRSQDKRILDAAYKSLILRQTMLSGNLDLDDFEEQWEKRLGDDFDPTLFGNAIRVIEDYIKTGGEHTSSSTGFAKEREEQEG